MPVPTCTPTRQMTVGDKDFVLVSFDDALNSGVSLTGTPTVAEITTSDLTLSNPTVNGSSEVIIGKTVAAGRAVKFYCNAASATDKTTYRIRITAATDTSPAGQKIRDVLIRTLAPGTD